MQLVIEDFSWLGNCENLVYMYVDLLFRIIYVIVVNNIWRSKRSN